MQSLLCRLIVVAQLLEIHSKLCIGFIHPAPQLSNKFLRAGAIDTRRTRSPGTPPKFLLARSSGQQEDNSLSDSSISSKESSELDRLIYGWSQITQGKALDTSNLSKLLTPEDVIATLAIVPLSVESIHTAFRGQVTPESYVLCSIVALTCSAAHTKMYFDTPRDWRCPRLGELRTVYQYSPLFSIPFAWMLVRITSVFPPSLEILDYPMAIATSGVALYGLIGGFIGKRALDNQGTDTANGGYLLPSDAETRNGAQLYLTGNIVLNVLVALFIPFVWVLSFKGTEWWHHVEENHVHEAAFFGVSILVALLGNASGNLLARFQQLGIVKSPEVLVVSGILSNFVLLIMPEVFFNVIYHSGLSEIGLYWEN
jgi:hypothetical protein